MCEATALPHAVPKANREGGVPTAAVGPGWAAGGPVEMGRGYGTYRTGKGGLDPTPGCCWGSLPGATHSPVRVPRGWEQSTQPPHAHADPTRFKRLGVSQNKYFMVNYRGLIIIKICTSDLEPGNAFQAAGGHMSTPLPNPAAGPLPLTAPVGSSRGVLGGLWSPVVGVGVSPWLSPSAGAPHLCPYLRSGLFEGREI